MAAHRTSISLDLETVEGIRRLASGWETSQAGAVRRAIALALANIEQPLSVADVLAQYRAGAVARSAEQLQNLSTQLHSERADLLCDRMQRLPSAWQTDQN